jgi:restriction endonuclease-like protein
MGAYASSLRQELCLRNAKYAFRNKLKHVLSYGDLPVVVYESFPEGKRHGNFLTESYKAILASDSWRRRLDKVHPQARKSLPKNDKGWRELDSCTSSDALLMNVFCHPTTLANAELRMTLSCSGTELQEFGFKARVPLVDGRTDQTEVDMRWGSVLFESKLTESDFQRKSSGVVERYRDLRVVFDTNLLPKHNAEYLSYQLIRNVLAAYSLGFDFCVLLDSRRQDLIEACWGVFRAVWIVELRTKCTVLTWQELTVFLPPKLRNFLDLKYGIVAPGEIASDFGSE